MIRWRLRVALRPGPTWDRWGEEILTATLYLLAPDPDAACAEAFAACLVRWSLRRMTRVIRCRPVRDEGELVPRRAP